MRSLSFLLLGFILIILQSSSHRLMSAASYAVESVTAPFGAHWELQDLLLRGATPNLVLPVVIFLGVHESNMVRGALLAFGIGYLSDVMGGAPIGLFTFVSVTLWWLSRVLGVRLTAQTVLTRSSLAFAFSLLEGALVLVLLAVFGADNRRPMELAWVVFPRALVTAVFAPFVFRIAQRLHQGAAPTVIEAGQR